ncbi:thrombospondin type 3 repeat-containing protein [Myxococcota bacterium]
MLSASVDAQEKSAFSDEFTVQRFTPAPGPRNFITTRSARSDGTMAYSLGLLGHWGWEPLVVKRCTTGTNCDAPDAQKENVKVVENVATADLMATVTILPELQLGLRAPITYVKGQGLTEQGRPDDPDGLSATGLGDVELEGKYRFYGRARDPVVAGGALQVTGPLGSATAKGKYIGDSGPTVGVRAILDGDSGSFTYGLNLGGLLRGTGRLGSTELGSELRYGVAAGIQAGPVVQVLVDGFGSTGFQSTKGASALEADLGLRVTPAGSPLVFLLGAGTGLLRGVGVPKLRVFLGATYVAEQRDRDLDGLPDSDDACPTEPEDRDGYEDDDGCPEPDNDGDTIPDVADGCPNDPEDFDAFEDLDGCPEPDNDGDGVADERDRCPDKKETVNKFKDDDGCPDEPDKDEDGVPDANDKCPTEVEDTDGFEDTDGCPDPDNDRDGVPDQRDECADEPETKNEYMDEDGCPDQPPAGFRPGQAPRPAPVRRPAAPARPPAPKGPAKPEVQPDIEFD